MGVRSIVGSFGERLGCTSLKTKAGAPPKRSHNSTHSQPRPRFPLFLKVGYFARALRNRSVLSSLCFNLAEFAISGVIVH